MVMEHLMSLLVAVSVMVMSVQVTTCGLRSAQAQRQQEARVREASCVAEYGTPECTDERAVVEYGQPAVRHVTDCC